MYSTCIYCHQSLGTNEDVPFFPVGRRLAVDAARGRLWVICEKCGRWNLSPLEERWEAIEACERLFRDTRLRMTTDNVGLARIASGFEIIRIGKPQRPELAAWRYGPQLLSRRRRTLPLVAVREMRIAYAHSSGAQLAVLLAEQVLPGLVNPALLLASIPAAYLVRHLRARRRLANVWNGQRVLTVRQRHLPWTRFRAAEDANNTWQLEFPHDSGTALLSGRHALNALGSLLVHSNDVGGSRRDIELAVKKLEYYGRPEALIDFAVKREYILALGHQQRLALEMAVHEDNERRALEGELALLEAAWREAEEVAAIADQLLVPQEIEDALVRLRQSGRQVPDATD